MLTELSERRSLEGMRVCISISESSRPEDRGAASEEVNRLTVRLAELLLGEGARLIFGHNWRRDGVMTAIHRAAIRYRREDQPVITNLLPWPDRPGLTPEEQAEAEAVIHIVPARLPADCVGEDVVPLSIEQKTWLRARALTHMRDQLVASTDAMICVGGRTSQSQGRYPGVVEEVLLMTAAGKPVYLSGLLGGAASDMIHIIERGADTQECQNRICTTSEDVIKAYAVHTGTEPGVDIDHVALCRHFAETLTVDSLRNANRLEEADQQELLHANGHQQVLTLIQRGLTLLSSHKGK